MYVVDDDNRLVGVLNMRDLMLAAPDRTLDEIRRNELFALHCFTDRHEAASELATRKFFAADIENHILGIVVGAVTALAAWPWYGNPTLGLVIGLGMLVNLIFAGLAGASIPLIMKKIGIDPAQSSSIILTTVTDVLVFLGFPGFAVLFQNALIA